MDQKWKNRNIVFSQNNDMFAINQEFTQIGWDNEMFEGKKNGELSQFDKWVFDYSD